MSDLQMDLFPEFSSPQTQSQLELPFSPPSWLRNRGNHCSTCAAWSKDKILEYVGRCCSPTSLDAGEQTDSRYRCQSFVRKEGT
jgi:hypothetical protein